MLRAIFAAVLGVGLLLVSQGAYAQGAAPVEGQQGAAGAQASTPASSPTPEPATAQPQVQPSPQKGVQGSASESPGVVQPLSPLTVQPATPLGGNPIAPSAAPSSAGPGSQTANPAPATPSVAPQSAAAPASEVRQSELPISSGDLLVVAVYGAPEYHYEVRVDPKGNVGLPLAGPIPLAGLTVSQAEQRIAAKLTEKRIFNDPQVSVFEKEPATQGITVLGEIQKPGIYPLMGPHTLADVISTAGGLSPRASDTATITHRDQPNQPQTVKLNDQSSGQSGRMAPVRPGDTVSIPKAGIVYVVGDVKEPAGFVMENNHITVLQAMAMAHGANPTAKLSAAKLVRNTPNGPQEVPVQVGKILAAKEPDIPLQPGDILFIPNSRAKTLTHKSLDAILNVAAAAAIYH
jgi:polysaccharide biosynthesis/export protein